MSPAGADSVVPFPTADVTVAATAHEQRIPHSFFGLSTEYWTLPQDELHVALYTHILSMLHVPGDGRYILRIGGDSTSRTLYDPQIRVPPRWAFELTPAFITQTARIVKEMRLRVILDLNLITETPNSPARGRRSPIRLVSSGSILGFEIGNEPDLYHRTFWVFATGVEQFSGAQLPLGITPDSYAQDYRAYARVLHRLVPDVPLVAPWRLPTRRPTSLDRNAARRAAFRSRRGERAPLSVRHVLTARLAGLSDIARILSEQATTGTARGVEPAIHSRTSTACRSVSPRSTPSPAAAARASVTLSRPPCGHRTRSSSTSAPVRAASTSTRGSTRSTIPSRSPAPA